MAVVGDASSWCLDGVLARGYWWYWSMTMVVVGSGGWCCWVRWLLMVSVGGGDDGLL